MPIVSGGSGGGGSVTLLSSTTLGADGTFDVSSISQAYNDLLLVFVGRGTRAAATDNLLLRLNNDSTAANYDGQRLSGALAVAAANTQNLGAISGIVIGFAIGTTGTANRATSVECWLHGYSGTTFHKNALSLGFEDFSADAGRELDACAGTWLSTTAITRVQLQGQTTANLLSGSSLRIYGRL